MFRSVRVPLLVTSYPAASPPLRSVAPGTVRTASPTPKSIRSLHRVTFPAVPPCRPAPPGISSRYSSPPRQHADTYSFHRQAPVTLSRS